MPRHMSARSAGVPTCSDSDTFVAPTLHSLLVTITPLSVEYAASITSLVCSIRCFHHLLRPTFNTAPPPHCSWCQCRTFPSPLPPTPLPLTPLDRLSAPPRMHLNDGSATAFRVPSLRPPPHDQSPYLSRIPLSSTDAQCAKVLAHGVELQACQPQPPNGHNSCGRNVDSSQPFGKTELCTARRLSMCFSVPGQRQESTSQALVCSRGVEGLLGPCDERETPRSKFDGHTTPLHNPRLASVMDTQT